MSTAVHRALLAADWPAPARVHACTTMRHGAGGSHAPFDTFDLGLRNGDDPDVVRLNRMSLARVAGLPSAPHWLQQVHATSVHRVDGRPHGPAEPIADAAVTTLPGEVLAVLTADCLPVLLCADDGSAVAAAHAGWRGLAGGIVEATIAALPVPPSRLLAWLGPAGGPLRYEVGAEVRSAFVDPDRNAAAAFVPTRPGHYLCDLYRLARMRLQRAGIDRIHGGDRCTISEPGAFYSHRRDATTGRMATLIWIDPA